MKAIGYAYCKECGQIGRAYPPRGWKEGEQLCLWRHREHKNSRRGDRCPGSYQPGTDSTLDPTGGAE